MSTVTDGFGQSGNMNFTAMITPQPDAPSINQASPLAMVVNEDSLATQPANQWQHIAVDSDAAASSLNWFYTTWAASAVLGILSIR